DAEDEQVERDVAEHVPGGRRERAVEAAEDVEAAGLVDVALEELAVHPPADRDVAGVAVVSGAYGEVEGEDPLARDAADTERAQIGRALARVSVVEVAESALAHHAIHGGDGDPRGDEPLAEQPDARAGAEVGDRLGEPDLVDLG